MAVLGIDIGTSGTRGVVVSENGNILFTTTHAHVDFFSPQTGWAEQDPDDWWNASKNVIRECVKAVSADTIKAVSFSGQMHGSVFLDRDGKVVRPALLWCDQRTETECLEITEAVGQERLISIAANPAVTGFTLPKILWLRKNEPENFARTASIMLPKDYIRFKLTGEKFCDVADASGTLLLDVPKRKWSSELLEVFGLSAQLLSEVVESIVFTGNISQTASDETGLNLGTPTYGGAGDNAAGAIGMGITRPGSVSSTIGTSGVIFAVSDAPAIDPKGRIHTLCHAIADRWHNTGVTLSAGYSLRWLRDNIASGKTFSELSDAASVIASGSNGLLWLPYLMGERSPHLDPHARAAFIGLTAGHNLAHMTRAIMEGVAFSLRDSLEIFKEAGVKVDAVRLGGGGATSPLWQQIQADVYGAPVEILEADEGAAFGAALIAGVGAGIWSSVDEACAASIKVKARIEPNKENSSALEKNYQIYRKLYGALKSVNDDLSSI